MLAVGIRGATPLSAGPHPGTQPVEWPRAAVVPRSGAVCAYDTAPHPRRMYNGKQHKTADITQKNGNASGTTPAARHYPPGGLFYRPRAAQPTQGSHESVA